MTRRRPLREIARLLRPYAADQRLQFSGGAMLGILVVVIHILRPWPVKWILDAVTQSTTGSLTPMLMHPASWGVAALSAAFVVIAIAGAGAEYWQAMTINGAGNKVLFRFRAALFTHVLRQPLAFHESRETGELLTRIVYDTSRLRRGLNGMLMKIVQTLVLFAATIGVLIWIDLALGAVMAVGGALALLSMKSRGRRIASAARKQRRKEGSLAALVANELIAIREIKAFGIGQSSASQQFEKQNRKGLRQEQKVRRLASGLALRVDVLLALAVSLALAIGAPAALNGRMTPGDLVLFFSYALALRAPFSDFAIQTARLGRTYACAERLARIAVKEPAGADLAGAIASPQLGGAITLDDVAVKSPERARGGRKWALDGVTLSVAPGERVALVGANGSGKSSLLRVVLRLTHPQRGTVSFDGVDAKQYGAESLRAQMSVVFQDSVLSGLTVRDNLVLGLPGASDDQLDQAVKAAGASRLLARLPSGYETPVRRGGSLFSGGERQRLALARAILRDGRVWLLDEPTAGLDPDGVKNLSDVLFAATEGKTVLWVTHELELLPKFDSVVALDSGRVKFRGTPAEYALHLDAAAAGSQGLGAG